MSNVTQVTKVTRSVHPSSQPPLNLITLGVRDLMRAATFYEAVGFIRRESTPQAVYFETRFALLSLRRWQDLANHSGLSTPGTGFGAVTLGCALPSAAEVDATYDRWVRAGGTGVRQPSPRTGGGYSGLVADQDAHLWDLTFNWPEADLIAAATARAQRNILPD